MRVGLVSASLAALCCVGCTVLTSESFDELKADGRSPRGTYYVLPKGVVDIGLSVLQSQGSFLLTVGSARYVPDKRHEYYLRYIPDPNYDDDISVTTTANGFLATVNSTVTDKTPEAIAELAKGIAGVRGLEVDTEAGEQLLSLTIDPLDPDDLQAASAGVSDRIREYVQTQLKSCGYYGEVGSPSANSLDYWKTRRATLQVSIEVLTGRKATKDAEVKTASDALKAAAVSNVKKIDCRPAAAQKGRPSEAQSQEVTALCRLLAQQTTIAEELAKAQAELLAAGAAAKAIEDAQQEQGPRCRIYEALKRDMPKARIKIFDHAGVPVQASAEGNNWVVKVSAKNSSDPAPDCKVGICYRPKEIFTIVYSLGAGDQTKLLELPNRAKLVEFDIRRTFLVKKVQKMTFTEGFLTKVDIDKESELLALSKIPVDIGDAILKGVQARAKITTKQKDAVKAEADLLRAQATLAETRARYQSGTATEAGRYESGPQNVQKRAPTGATSRVVTP